MAVPTRSAGLVPAIPIIKALCPCDRDRRDRPGDDELAATSFAPLPGRTPNSLHNNYERRSNYENISFDRTSVLLL
jgi:hypothetical protein